MDRVGNLKLAELLFTPYLTWFENVSSWRALNRAMRSSLNIVNYDSNDDEFPEIHDLYNIAMNHGVVLAPNRLTCHEGIEPRLVDVSRLSDLSTCDLNTFQQIPLTHATHHSHHPGHYNYPLRFEITSDHTIIERSERILGLARHTVIEPNIQSLECCGGAVEYEDLS